MPAIAEYRAWDSAALPRRSVVRASSSHTTILDGNTGPQTVTFSNPGTTTSTQQFQDLTIENFGDPVNLASTAVVAGTFFSDDVELARTGAGAVMDVRGTLNVNATRMIGLPLRVETSVDASQHFLNFVEFLGMLIKPFSLCIRLFANMMAGHVVILALISLIFILGTIWVAPVSVAFALFIYLLEILVGFIQAFIFTMLTAQFIGMSVHPH